MIPEPIAAAVDIFRKKADTFQVQVVCFERFAPENLEEHGWECRLPFWSLLSANNLDFYDRRRKEIILSARDIQVFLDPVIDMAHVYLVGGGAENAYILRSVKQRIKDKHALDVYTPDKPQLAVVNGAGVYGLDDVLTIHKCPQHIGIECAQRYDADRHGQPRPELLTQDPVDGRNVVTGPAIWVFDIVTTITRVSTLKMIRNTFLTPRPPTFATEDPNVAHLPVALACGY
ncbi:hypothetical protein BO85DRAFT_434334 [Aspergillus piperis CBS 112811]|uniref:Actin-like ATPase domain-containing protein n=1 Tax=Aspergillus piperis CBS 112811 TaxID=1448313 RepID=A0A8G1RAV0_9EURO|nr:hypothetical protein BO85DRAFT_434334 [Aspergillus piperis CBS 112811]RAH61662.1 hypothetical protein BO85DRAFT_434334 [Aspergillus piperis CBS 112811]